MKNFCRGLAFCFCPVGRLYETGLSAAEAGSVPSFPASNESADSWCRHGRHYFIWQRTSILFGNAPRYPLPLLLPHGGSRLGSDGGKADGRLKAPAAGTVCLQTRAVARRRYQPFGRRHRNRSGGFCCFSPPKSREKERVFRRFSEKRKRSPGGFSPLKTKKKPPDNQQRILPCRKAPMPSICRANSLRAVRS